MTAGVPENKRTYSSVHRNEKPGTGHARSTLDSPQAWSAKKIAAGEWMQIDLGKARSVAGTVVQSRQGSKQYGGRFVGQYVTGYTVSTSLDGKSFQSVAGLYTGKIGTVKNLFASGGTRKARYVRLTVKSFHSWPSMRADVLVTDTTYGPGESFYSNHNAKHTHTFYIK